MSEYLTEEEQLEALKRWWKDNGKSTVTAVVLAVVGYFGFEFWQDQVRAGEEAASNKYQSLLESVVVAPGTNLSDTARTTAASLAAELKQDSSNGFYGQSAALFMAKLAIEANQLDKAEAELQWVLDQNPEQALALVSRLRLARVQAAASKFDTALATLTAVDAGSFIGEYAEVRGDILLAQGNVDEARAAYQLAVQSQTIDMPKNENLQIKLDDLAPAIVAADKAAQ